MVSERGIETNPNKIRVILDMPVPRNKKERSEVSWVDFSASADS